MAVTSVQLVRVLLALAAVDVLLWWLGPKGEDEDRGEESKEQDTPAESTGYAEDLKGSGWQFRGGFWAGLLGS